MSVVVVGAAGGIGRRVLMHLDPGEVIAIDRVPVAGACPSIQCELSDSAAVRSAAMQVPPGSCCVFVAGRLSDANVEAAEIVRDNVTAPAVFLATAAPRLEAFVLLSSVSVYGRQETLPISEDVPLAPTTLYGGSKAAGEAVLRALAARESVPLAIIRSTQLFGVSSAASTLPHQLIALLRRGGTPVIAVDPKTIRDYLHVDDLAELLVRVARTHPTTTANAGSGRAMTLRDVVRAAFAAFGARLEEHAVFTGSEPSESQLLDISRARETFGFEARVKLEEWFQGVAAGADEFLA